MTLSRTCPTHDQINDYYCPTPYQLWLVFVKLNFQKLLLIKQWFYTMFSFNKLHFIVWNCFSNIYVLLYNENSFANMVVILKTYQILLQYSLLETIEGHVMKRPENWYRTKKDNSKQIQIFCIIYFRSENKNSTRKGNNSAWKLSDFRSVRLLITFIFADHFILIFRLARFVKIQIDFSYTMFIKS